MTRKAPPTARERGPSAATSHATPDRTETTDAMEPVHHLRQAPAGDPPDPAAQAALLHDVTGGRIDRAGAALLQLQRDHGNQFVQEVMRSTCERRQAAEPATPAVQPKLVVGPIGDRHEREAERVATNLAGSDPDSLGREPVREMVQATPSPEGHTVASGAVDTDVAQAIVGARGRGRSLPEQVRAPLAASLGADFSAVRIHADAGADRLTRSLGAVAFTTGEDIFFRRDMYRPDSQPGWRLLAHELTHVVQQRGLPRQDDAAPPEPHAARATSGTPIQRKIGFEYELDAIRTRHTESYVLNPYKTWVQHNAGDVLLAKNDYSLTADIGDNYSRLEFVTEVFDERTQLQQLLNVADDIVDDIKAIKAASIAHEKPGYGAGNRWVWGGQEGWFASDRWVGLDMIPRLRGSWREQVEFAARPSTRLDELTGQLQMTGGFSLTGLQRLTSGAAFGNVNRWKRGWQSTRRQFVTPYAHTDEPIKLYQVSSNAVREARLTERGGPGSAGVMASIVAVMAQVPLQFRSMTFDLGRMQAKTDYAKILHLVAEDKKVHLQKEKLLQVLLRVVNEHIQGSGVTGDSPVVPARWGQGAAGVNLGKVTFRDWVYGIVPVRSGARGKWSPGRDLLTRAHFPGTAEEKTALRAFGRYGKKMDPGERPIFELRGLMMNPVSDLRDLVEFLATRMQTIQT